MGNVYLDLIGPAPKLSVSKDGTSITASSEIAEGIPISLNFRLSDSKGNAVDAEIDRVKKLHVESW